MSDELSKNSERPFKHPQDDPNTCLPSTKSWSKQPLAAKIYQKGADVCPIQSEFPLDLNTRSNQELPVPLSNLEQTATAENPALPNDGNYFFPFKIRTKRQKQPPIIVTDYERPKNKILKTKGIMPGTFDPYDGFIFPHSPTEEQDYEENVRLLFPESN